MRILINVLALVLASSCHPREYTIIRNFKPKEYQTLDLGNTYQFFARKIYIKSKEQNSLADQAINSDSTRNQLIEIEYILFSTDSNTLLYITTVPDRYQRYYANHDQTFLESQLNVRDFNTFHFGKIKHNDTNKADFSAYKRKIKFTWEYNMDTDSLLIRRVVETKDNVYQDERSVENSLYLGASFKKVNHFEFVYKDKKDTTLYKMSDPIIYVSHKRKKYSVYLHFDSALRKRFLKRHVGAEDRSKLYNTIKFKGPNRIPYSPADIVN